MKQSIRFAAADAFAMPPGLYRVEAKQSLNSHESFSEKLDFVVSGSRFVLPGGLHTVFPPRGAAGDFRRCLPQALIAGCSRAENNCLLVLNDEDSFRLSGAALQQLVQPPSGITGPTVILDPSLGETNETPCTLLDLPAGRLCAALPPLQDLPYLMHLRAVDTQNRRASQELENGLFLFLNAHRPPAGATGSQLVTVCLVSLEGLSIPKDENAVVRLPVLGSWQFLQEDSPWEFSALLSGLNTGMLRSPLAGPEAPVPLLHGYTPIPHSLRQGDSTVSWYRGPLLPCREPTEELGQVDFADSLTRYDPDTGLFDVSLSCAWQLGKLMGLQSGTFSAGLVRSRRENQHKLLLHSEQQRLSHNFCTAEISGDWHDTLDSLCADCLSPAQQQEDNGPGLAELAADPAVWRAVGTRPTEPGNWLEELRTLSGVPFQYLVPEEAALPPESLRFFYLDSAWVQALTAGACSIGRSSFLDALHDSCYFPALCSETLQTGFFLRSALVSSLPGLEVLAFADTEGKEPIQAIRLERLGSDLLFALFPNKIARLELLQPAEGLHLSCVSHFKLRDFTTGAYTEKTVNTVFAPDGRALDFAATAAAFSATGSPLAPDSLALQLLQTAQKGIYYWEVES